MKVFGIFVVKNEADIIEYSLNEYSKWAEKIFILDNASTDGTWEIVKQIALTNPKIIPWKQTDELFHDGMRADVFNEFKHYASNDDWWCMRMDADEFYIQNPISVLSQINKNFHVVCSKHIQYRLTSLDLENIDFNEPIDSVISKLKYHDNLATSEIRFFRHRDRLKWDRNFSRPTHIGLVSEERILIRHYQYRSPKQIEKRIQTRQQLKIKYPNLFPHVFSNNWKDYIIDNSNCIYDAEGTISNYKNLPLANNQNLKYKFWSYWIQRFLHLTKIWP